jgi:hypothetical protein
MLLRFNAFTAAAALLSCSTLLVYAGCGQHDQIAKYTVPKPELVDPTLVSNADRSAATAAEQQTLGLIVPAGDKSWFFKLTGETQAVEPHHEEFLQFIMSVKFPGGADADPSWTLPDGWQQLPGSQFRFATLRLPATQRGEKPLEISVSSAGGDVLGNVNRWRGQLNLQPITADELASSTKTLKIDGRDATLVSLVGKGSGTMQGPPFAASAGSGGALPPDHPPLAGGKSSAGAVPSSAGPVHFDAPPEWNAAPQNAFSLAAFKVTDGDKAADITISAAGGDLLSNVNRWRGQLGLSPVSAPELADSAQKIDTLGTQADYVELIGPESGGKGETILGVRAAAGGRTWFIKLKGDSELARREKPRFEAFVKSLKLP